MDLWSMSTGKEQKTIKSRRFFSFFLSKFCFVYYCFWKSIMVTRHSFKISFLNLAFLEIEWRFHDDKISISYSQFGAEKQINKAEKQPQELAKCRTLEKTSELIVLAIRIGERSISFVVWTCGVHNLLYQQWKNHQIWLMIFMKNNRDPIVEEVAKKHFIIADTFFWALIHSVKTVRIFLLLTQILREIKTGKGHCQLRFNDFIHKIVKIDFT